MLSTANSYFRNMDMIYVISYFSLNRNIIFCFLQILFCRFIRKSPFIKGFLLSWLLFRFLWVFYVAWNISYVLLPIQFYKEQYAKIIDVFKTKMECQSKNLACLAFVALNWAWKLYKKHAYNNKSSPWTLHAANT